MDAATTRIFSDVFAIIEASKQQEADATLDQFATWLSGFGVTSFLVARLAPQQDARFEAHVIVNRWPADWYARYVSAGHYRYDPCVRYCFSRRDPFAWSDLPPDYLRFAKPRWIMNEAADFNLRQGVCIPLDGIAGFRSVLTLAGAHIEIPPQAFHAFPLLALCALTAAVPSARPASWTSEERLSDRERQVLGLTAEGNTAGEIAERLTITQNTVNTHLQNARRKLGATSTIQAYAEALRRREISL